MNLRPYILTLFYTFVAVFALQACGVDPLDPADKFGKTVCEDKSLPDTDGDGVNDKCEEILGTDKLSGDTDGDGVEDGNDFPQPQVPSYCPQADPNNYPPECQQYWEANGQRRNNLEEISRAGLLANSALNAKAPNGTQIDVQDQFIRIVYGSDNSTNGSAGADAALASFCTKDVNGTVSNLTNYIYYKVQGSVKYCNASIDGPNSSCEGTAQVTQLELCGPLENPAVATPASNQDITFENFKWSNGKTPLGEFRPHTLIKEEEAPATLILTPHDLQNVGGGVYKKMKVRFKKSFQVEGKIPNPQANNGGNNQASQYGDYIWVETTENVDTQRGFKRTGVIDATFATQYPKMLGPWSPAESIF